MFTIHQDVILVNNNERKTLHMTSSIIEKQNQISCSNNNIYNNNPIIPSYQNTTSENLTYTPYNQNNHNVEPSNLLPLSMIHDILNFNLQPPNNVDKELKNLNLPFQEIQKITNNKMNLGLTPFLMSEYQRIKVVIDNSGLLSPNENLITKNRGECFWSNCYFQSDIEENFKKHMNDCHSLTSSALAQIEISLEKSLQLSTQLVKEQNHLYNMMLHMDQKLKSLPVEMSSISDYHYLSLLLNKFKQTPNIFDCITDQSRTCNEDSSLHKPQQLSLDSNNHLLSHPQHSTIINSSNSNLSQQLIDNLSSVLLKQQTIQVQAQNTHYQQSLFSTGQNPQVTNTFRTNILPILKREINNSNFVKSTKLITPSNDNENNSNHSIINIESNLKDIILSQSLNSNYSQSNSATSVNIKVKKNKRSWKTPSDCEGRPLSNNMTDREYYRQYAVRPGASYVNLIKTAIQESSRMELSLNEIYVWMQSEFAYFRDKDQKWKNAIRHNLSLHKCFQRKHGKLWTFNENEYNQKKSRNRFQSNGLITRFENTNIEDDEYEEDENNEDDETLDGVVKKEMEYNYENRSKETVLDTDEWSNYLHKNTLKGDHSTTVNLSILPNFRIENCPNLDI